MIPTLDNLDDATETQTFAGSTYSGGQIVTGNLRTQSTTLLDPENRAYETDTYAVNVNPTTGVGTAGDYLPTDTWYDPRGLVVKTVTGKGPFQKTSYDAAGRPTYQVNYGREDTGSGVAHYIFDTNGNLIAATDGNPLVSEQPPSPNSSNNYIVSETGYNPHGTTGPIVDAINNLGIVSETQSDLAGRTLRTIDNYVAAGPDQNGNPVAADTAEDVTTVT